MRHEPPRLAMRLLALRLPPDWRDFVLGDLEEEFGSRAAASLPAARRWLWRQALRCLATPPKPRISRPRPPQGDPFMRTVLSDTRQALRVFQRAPSFALAVVAVLALGDRRQHRHLQPRQRGAAQAATL